MWDFTYETSQLGNSTASGEKPSRQVWMGPVFRLTRSWAEIDASSSARVTLDRSNRQVSFTSLANSIERTPTGALIGSDMGIALSITTSDGTGLHMPKLLSPGEAQRKRRLR